MERSPTDILLDISHSFGKLLSPINFRRKNANPVSYYALFKGLQLLSKPSGYQRIFTTFLHLANYLRALTGDLGSFPLDYEAYPSQSY